MKPLLRWLLLVLATALALQLFFLLRIAAMATVAPQSTAFERSEAWRLANRPAALRWRQQWVDYDDISNHLKRAVIASEDDSFSWHEGVDWEALEQAWQRNARAEAQADKSAARGRAPKRIKIVGGSTITQQLAKNLLLSGERTMLRKAQEFVLTMMLELLLDKRRILEIYLNHVEWGEGVFGAEAAARHYFGKSAASLTPHQAARLAVMLPRPKYYEKRGDSAYLAERSAVIVERLRHADLP